MVLAIGERAMIECVGVGKHAQLYIGDEMEIVGDQDAQIYGEIIEDYERSEKYYWFEGCGEVSHIIEVTGKCSFEGICEIIMPDSSVLEKEFSVTISGIAY